VPLSIERLFSLHIMTSKLVLRTNVASRALRTYATQSKAASIKPPIQTNGLAGTYAGAAYSAALAKSEKSLANLESDLQSILKIIKSDTKVANFLNNPTLSPADRTAGISEILKGAKTNEEVTKNLFTILSENGRLYEAEHVINEFTNLMSAYRGEITITITTAQPLESSLQQRLERALKESSAAKAGKSVKFVNKVNEDVLGGLVVDFGDKSIDLSVVSRANKLNNMLETTA